MKAREGGSEKAREGGKRTFLICVKGNIRASSQLKD